MKTLLKTILKYLPRRSAGILDSILAAILIDVFRRMFASGGQKTLTMPTMSLALGLLSAIALLSSYILLYNRLKQVSTYLELRGTSWETVKAAVEFSKGCADALKLDEKGKLK